MEGDGESESGMGGGALAEQHCVIHTNEQT